MKLTRAQQEAKLREAAEEMIEGLLSWEAETEAPNLTQMEEVILALRERMGQEMLKVVLGGQESQEPVEAPACPKCGGEMRTKGGKRRKVESRVGGVTVERTHYYCAHCQSGIFPPGSTT
jgi:uncharacterized protein with PIN domain